VLTVCCSKHAEWLISYRPPHRIVSTAEEATSPRAAAVWYGYEVDFVEQVQTHMMGSGEGHTAYIYRRRHPPPAEDVCTTRLLVPARAGVDEVDVEVACDPAFLAAATAAVGPLEVLKTHTDALMAAHLSSGRPTRTRRPARVVRE